ncbi:hypothetical protein GCM10023212_24450 [Luteolibacter yonseiensis]
MVAAVLPGWIHAAVRGVYVGNDFYPPITKIEAARTSGFNRLFLFTLHISANGDVYYNDTPVVRNGVYVGDPAWASSLAALRPEIHRIELVIGSWGDQSFSNIKSLVASDGTGSGSLLYKSFEALKNATGADAIQFDDESTYDVSSAVKFGKMIAGLGMKVTLCPYTAQNFWVNVKAQLGADADAVYLQCYDGGAGNNPATWNNAFGGFKVYPGLWGNTDTPPSVTSKMRNWQQTQGMDGGFMWLNEALPSDARKWAQSLAYGLEPLNGLVAADFGVNYAGTGFTGNQGFGFGPWTLSTTGGGSYISGGTSLFSIWNSAANGRSTAVRSLSSPLKSGQSLLVELQMNNLDNANNSNRFELRDSAGNVLFSYFHRGGDNADGHYTDAIGTHPAPGFAYHFGQLDSFRFSLDSATTFTFTDITTARSVSGTLSGAAVSQVAFVRTNGATVPGNGQDFRFTGLVVHTPTTLPVALAKSPTGWTIRFDATPCLTYRVQRSTRLDGGWNGIGEVFAPFNQSSFTDTDPPAGKAFYRLITP